MTRFITNLILKQIIHNAGIKKLISIFLLIFLCFCLNAQLVGINTTDPQRQLHLKGDSYIDGIMTIRNFDTNTNNIDILHSGILGNGHIDVYGEGGLYLNYFSGENVVIGNGNGSVHTTFNTDGSISFSNGNVGNTNQTILSAGPSNEVAWGNPSKYIYQHTYAYQQTTPVTINGGNPNEVLPGLDINIDLEYPSKVIITYGARVTNNGSALKQSLIEFNLDTTAGVDDTISIYTDGGDWDTESTTKILTLPSGGYTVTVAGQNTANGSAAFNVTNGFMNIMVIPQ